MAYEAISGNRALLYYFTKGTLLEATDTLVINTLYLVASRGLVGVSTLDTDLLVGQVFMSKSATPITLAVGDSCYPLTLTEKCRGDISLSMSKGTIECTDSCSGGYNRYVIDGFTDMTGSFTGHFKVGKTEGISTGIKEMMKRFIQLMADDAVGGYVLTEKSDQEVLFHILIDSERTTAGEKQVWLDFSAHLTNMTQDKPYKGIQNADFDFSLGQEIIPTVYERLIV